jgi:hypothetical protein
VTRIPLLHTGRRATLVAGLTLAAAAVAGTATVYRWTDDSGVIHLSSSKPPAGVRYETLNVPTSSGGGSSGSRAQGAAASPAQVAQRSEVLASLRNRECVIALEALDRITSGTRPTDAAEINRLKQTVDANCSSDPTRRREQEDMAAQLRVANGPECTQARNELADMMSGRTKATAEQQRAQQAFVDGHCVPPVQ